MNERWKYRLYGVVFIAIAVMLAGLMVAFYNKAFTPVYTVTVDSDRAGLQLLPHSDVKVRGLIVGEVRGISATPNGAAIKLGIYPDKAKLIPDNVSARMLPKTVFGEKFVDLVIPAGVRGPHLKSGDVIPEDRSTVAVEINQVLNDLLPVLRAVKPAQLNTTLNTLATALQGRGAELGETVDEADAYLRTMNPHLPTLLHDLQAVGTVSDNINGAAPDLLDVMSNLQVTSKTIVDKQTELQSTLTEGISLTNNATPFVADNENRLVGAMIANRPALSLIAKYSPTIPCVLEGQAVLQPRLKQAMGGGQPGVHVTLELVKPRPGYKPGLDNPENSDHRNPRCYGLPNPPSPFPQYQLLDGTEDDQWWAGGSTSAGRGLSSVLVKPTSDSANDQMIKDLLGPALGTQSSNVSDLAEMLYAPAASGMVVNVK
jgi:phospholipid/cholesterol/gamma-HCH transport system substrate-binding protein